MLELLGYIGFDRDSTCVQRALQHLRDTQEADGSWYGRWGVNYIYGTWQVLRGLRAIGEDMRAGLDRARARLARELPERRRRLGRNVRAATTTRRSKAKAPAPPSQTAWALMGLVRRDANPTRAAIRRGIEYLVRTQNRDGSWPEPQTTGTGFPRVFYLQYDMYRNNWPLLALATAANYRSGLFHQPSRYLA